MTGLVFLEFEPYIAGNYKHPTYPDCLKWVTEVWDNLSTDGVKSKAQELGMSADLGPEIEGFVDEDPQFYIWCLFKICG